MSLGPQYTSCVEAKDFEPSKDWYVGILIAAAAGGSIAALFTGGLTLVIAIPALVEALHYVSDWMLNHKLICLHRDASKMCGDHELVWALGEVADTEDVGEDKNPIEDIDNDYAMNVILAPFNMMVFGDSAQNNLKTATTGTPQGDLLDRQKDMPKFNGYFRTMIVTSDGKYRAWTDVVRPTSFPQSLTGRAFRLLVVKRRQSPNLKSACAGRRSHDHFVTLFFPHQAPTDW